MSKSFTLVELLVVIAIIGILTGFLLSSVSQTKKQAQRVECLNFQRQLYIFYYVDDWDEGANEICEMGFLPEEQWVVPWLLEPRQFFDDKTPIDLINEGNTSKVCDLLRFIETDEADIWEPMEYRDAQDRIRRGDVPSAYE